MKTKARQQSKERHLNPKHWGSVLELYRACLNNAIDLAKEAELLYQHEHYARAVALSLIAIEYNPSDGRKYHKWRMESIYVDYSEDYKPQEPKKQFTKEDARKSIDFVQKEIKDILQMEYITERIGSKSFMK